MTYNSISELESRLQYLSKSALEQVARYVGVSRFYAMNMEQLRAAILAISQGEVAPLPIYQRHIPRLISSHQICPSLMTKNGAIIP